MKQDEMGGTCSIHGRDYKCIVRHSIGRIERYFTYNVWVWTGFIWLRIVTSDGLLLTWS
jgi:hypothetical protein